jgi:hypothetical protein
MDDTRTQQALDQLADLFLTGQGPVPKTPDPVRDGDGDELVGPAPIRLGPKLASAPPVPPAPDVREADEPPIEGAAPLRLQPDPDDSPLASIGEVDQPDPAPDDTFDPTQTLIHAPADDPPGSEAPAPAVAVEAVVLGNLPGLSGPWLTQYAQLLAQQEGPVAILHVDDDLVDLELVQPTHRDTHGRGDNRGNNRGVSLRMPPGGGKIDPVSVLQALLDSPDSAPGTILVHLDPQNDEHGLARALSIDDWTLMCGADDLAIVGGYKMLKAMVEKDPAVARKHVGLMVMGGDPKDSQDAARKFQSAAESFLNTPVQLLGWQKQMVPVNLRHLGRFEDVDAAWSGLVDWFDRFAQTDTAAVAEPTITEPTRPAVEVEVPAAASVTPPEVPPVVPPVIPRTVPPVSAPPSAPIQEPEPVLQAAAADVAPADPPRPRLSELFTGPPPAATKPRRVEPKSQPETNAQVKTKAPGTVQPPAPEPTVTAQSTSDEPNLIELLMAGLGSVPGGIALEARCPHQNRTQLMLDQAGRLHLLCRHDSGGLDSLQAAMVDLLQASHWVKEHLELLQLTQRQCKFDVSSEPVLHLFTDRADWATALIARLGDGLKLHLLQEVTVGEASAWFCTPLN